MQKQTNQYGQLEKNNNNSKTVLSYLTKILIYNRFENCIYRLPKNSPLT